MLRSFFVFVDHCTWLLGSHIYYQIRKNGRWRSRPAISSHLTNGLCALGVRINRSTVYVLAIRFYSALQRFPETTCLSVIDRTLQVVVHTKCALPTFSSQYPARLHGRGVTGTGVKHRKPLHRWKPGQPSEKILLDGDLPFHQGLCLFYLISNKKANTSHWPDCLLK